MRVVAGIAGGRRLQGPASSSETRPTTDRVREAIFNSLESAGTIGGATVADLFAGSGACGIEALSRGAASVTFVDSDRHAGDVIGANLAALGFDGTVVTKDAVAFLRTGERFDVVIADPPYEFDRWQALFDAANASVVVCESSRPVTPPDGWNVVRQKKYGGTVVTVAQNQGPSGPAR